MLVCYKKNQCPTITPLYANYPVHVQTLWDGRYTLLKIWNGTILDNHQYASHTVARTVIGSVIFEPDDVTVRFSNNILVGLPCVGCHWPS